MEQGSGGAVERWAGGVFGGVKVRAPPRKLLRKQYWNASLRRRERLGQITALAWRRDNRSRTAHVVALANDVRVGHLPGVPSSASHRCPESEPSLSVCPGAATLVAARFHTCGRPGAASASHLEPLSDRTSVLLVLGLSAVPQPRSPFCIVLR